MFFFSSDHGEKLDTFVMEITELFPPEKFKSKSFTSRFGLIWYLRSTRGRRTNVLSEEPGPTVLLDNMRSNTDLLNLTRKQEFRTKLFMFQTGMLALC